MILNLSIALIVFMGLASGGLLALVLISTRQQAVNFSIMFALSLLLAVGGTIGSASLVESATIGITNAVVLVALSFSLGYTLTTFSVLQTRKVQWSPEAPQSEGGHTAVICLSGGEPAEYSVWSAARRFELVDDTQDVPPLLLRPFYMRDLKGKYAAIGRSPYRDYQLQLAEKVKGRLDSAYRVKAAFYSDAPRLAEAVAASIEEGASKIVLAHMRVTDPPDAALAGDLLEGMDLDRMGVKLAQVGPLWDSELLPQVYVRRVLEALPDGDSGSEIGLLLVGRGHAAQGDAARARRDQEYNFQRRVREAMLRLGFDESHVEMGWLRGSPTATEALHTLIEAGCRSVYWMPSTYPADGVNTLYDVPAQLEAPARAKGIKLVALGAWNADDLAAEDIVARVRAL